MRKGRRAWGMASSKGIVSRRRSQRYREARRDGLRTAAGWGRSQEWDRRNLNSETQRRRFAERTAGWWVFFLVLFSHRFGYLGFFVLLCFSLVNK